MRSEMKTSFYNRLHDYKAKQTLKELTEYEKLTEFENVLMQERKKQANQFLGVNEEKLNNLNTVIDLIRTQKRKILKPQLPRNTR